MEKESGTEKVWRFGRNINALGAVAIGGVAALIPGPNIILAGWAGLNAAQAGGFELLRRNSKKKKEKKENKK